MAEAIAAAAKALLKKLAVDLALDKDKRNKFLLIVGSIVVGLIFLLMTPIVVLSSIGGIEPPTVELEFNELDFLNSMDDESRRKFDNIFNHGQAIETAMNNADVKNQTIKAQLIYMSFLENVQYFDAESYANLFAIAPNDSDLIAAINSNYDLEINYDDFMRTYTFVMNATINPYMFSDVSTKNCADLAAWAENAYLSGWSYYEGCFGEMDKELRYRCADNVGLIMGYLRYMPSEKSFNMSINELIYNEIGELDTMPDVVGIGVLNQLSERLSELSHNDFVKLKAVMESENIYEISDTLDCIGRLDEYQLDRNIFDQSDFGRVYLLKNIHKNFDCSAFKDMNLCDFGQVILERKQGEITSYGVISGRGQELYSALTIQAEQQLDEDMGEDVEMEMGGISL